MHSIRGFLPLLCPLHMRRVVYRMRVWMGCYTLSQGSVERTPRSGEVG
jgi:hypothetical protein